MTVFKKLFETQKQILFQFLKNVTVEPLLSLYIIGNVLAAYGAQNLYLDKACRVNLGYSDKICDAVMRKDDEDYKDVEIEVQKVVVDMQKWKIVLQSFIPCLLILFIGSWSDRHKRRKPCMLIPIFGEFLSSAALVLNVYFKSWPMEAAGVAEALFEGITGGWATMLMASFSYIGDITTEDERTFRIGIANTFFSVGMPIATGMTGVILRYFGFYGVFLISTIILFITFLYGLIWIKDSTEYISNSSHTKENNSEITNTINNPTGLKSKNFLFDFFDPTNPLKTLKIICMPGKTLQILILLVVVILVTGPMLGEQAVVYLYTRLKFNWNEVDYGLYLTYSSIVAMVGSFTAITLFSHVFKMHDALIGVIGSLAKILSCFVYAFAVKSIHFYYGPLVEFFHGSSLIAMRSIASKMVEEERARLNSLVGLVESLTPSIYGPMYSKIYGFTLTVFPGAFYMIGAGFKVIAVFIFAGMYVIYRKKSSNLKISTVTQKNSKNTNEC